MLSKKYTFLTLFILSLLTTLHITAMKRDGSSNIFLEIPQEVTLLIATRLPRHNIFNFFAVDKQSKQNFQEIPLYRNYLKKAFQNYLSLRGVEKSPDEDKTFQEFYADENHKKTIDSLLFEHVEMNVIREREWYNFFDLKVENEYINPLINLQTFSLKNSQLGTNIINKLLYIIFKFQPGFLYEFDQQVINNLLEKTNENESLRICLYAEMVNQSTKKYRKNFFLSLMKYIKTNQINQVKIIDPINKFIDVIEKRELHLHLGHELRFSELIENIAPNIKIYLPNPLSLLHLLQNLEFKNNLITRPTFAQYLHPYNFINLPNETINLDDLQFACKNNLAHFYINTINQYQFLYSSNTFENHKKIIDIVGKNISPYYYTIYNSPYDLNLSFITALILQLTPSSQSKKTTLINSDLHWITMVDFIFETIRKTDINIMTYECKYIKKALSEIYKKCHSENQEELNSTIPSFLKLYHQFCKQQYQYDRDNFQRNAYLISKLSLLFLHDFSDQKQPNLEDEKLLLGTQIAQLADSNATEYESFITSLSKKLGTHETSFRKQYLLFANITIEPHYY